MNDWLMQRCLRWLVFHGINGVCVWVWALAWGWRSAVCYAVGLAIYMRDV